MATVTVPTITIELRGVTSNRDALQVKQLCFLVDDHNPQYAPRVFQLLLDPTKLPLLMASGLIRELPR